MSINYDKWQRSWAASHKVATNQDNINKYAEGVGIVLNLLGMPEALVTDHAQLSDFDNGEHILEALSLRDVCPPDSLLWEIAQRITDEQECG